MGLLRFDRATGPVSSNNMFLVLTKDKKTERWQTAATGLQGILAKLTGYEENPLRVEISNPSRQYCDVREGFSNPSNHMAATEFFDKIKMLIGKEVEESCGDGWKISLDLCGKREAGQCWRPTLRISVQPGTIRCWGTIEDTIQKALESVECMADIEIHLELTVASEYD